MHFSHERQNPELTFPENSKKIPENSKASKGPFRVRLAIKALLVKTRGG